MASRDTGRNTRGETSTGTSAPDTAGLGARRAALQAVAEIIGQERPPALEETLALAIRAETLSPADAALARAIAVATFRRYGLIRAALAARLERGLPVEKPRLTALLATATAQILDLAVPDHAAVDCAVRLAKGDNRTTHLAGWSTRSCAGSPGSATRSWRIPPTRSPSTRPIGSPAAGPRPTGRSGLPPSRGRISRARRST